ncbi:DNA polymerase III subunit beta [Desulfobaculum senezii]|jgi:DNA polymerase-3 subunit beta|uniref:DNA polymerase III subunit beta n=1 Tax=Desulfobaculum sp. SPO524 TaxID=3378071 RepID=UPI0038519C37
MFLKVFRDDIIEGLQKSASIIPAKTGAAFLRTIWLKVDGGALRIMSTDSNLEFCGTYTAEIIEEGLVGVQGRSFYDLIRKLPPGQITLKADDEGQHLSIQQGSRKYKLPTNEKSWFQNFSEFPEENSVFWAGDFLQELIDKTAYCISDEDTMEAIACLSLMPDKTTQHIESCGLNGHQFAMLRFLHDDLRDMLPDGGVLIQKKYLVELKKWLSGDEIELNIDNKRLFFRTADKKETFSLPLSFYQYPDYHTFLDKIAEDGVSEMTADRLELIDALERIIIFNTENNRCAYFQLGGELVIYSQGQDVGTASESLDVDFTGDLKKIAFPTRNLIEILNHFSSDKVNFKLTGAEGPCGVCGEDDPEYQVIIMPMKIVEETYYSEEGTE